MRGVGVGRRWCRGRLDLQRDDAAVRDLDHEVDLAATVRLMPAVAYWPVRPELELWAQLRDGEDVDESTEQVTVAHGTLPSIMIWWQRTLMPGHRLSDDFSAHRGADRAPAPGR